MPVVVVSGQPVQGGPAKLVYFLSAAEAAQCGIEGGLATPVTLINDSDLLQNGGQYWLDGDPMPMPVYEQSSQVGMLGGPALAVVNTNITPNYIVWLEPFTTLDAWTVTGEAVNLSGGVASLTDTGAGVTQIQSKVTSFILPTTQYTYEAGISVPLGQKCTYGLNDNSAARVTCVINGNGNNTLRFSSQGQAYVDYAPTNWDCRLKFKIIIWVDPVNLIARLYLYWKDTSTAQGRMEQFGAATSFSFTNLPTKVTISTGGSGTGTVTAENIIIQRGPWGVIIGDSLATGHPHYDPVTSFYTPQYWPYSIDSYMDVGRNNHIRVINNGIGGQTSTDLAARIATMVVNMKPKYCFLEIGVNDSGGALATYQANMGTIVDAINAAGIKPVIFEIAPLGGLPAGQITWVANANAWLPGFAASKGAIMIYCFSVLNNPADSGHPLPTYMADDGIHLSAAGYQFMASQVRNLI